MLTAPAQPETLYLIDGHAQFFRAYHAIRPGLTSPVTGEPTNMTFGFVGMLLKLMRDYAPTYVAVAIDVGGDRGSFRSELFPEYKANRPEPPEDLHPQVERCVGLLETMRIPVLAMEGVEADDVIATVVKRLHTERPDLRIRIVSRDKDLTQMLREGVELYDVHRDQGVTPADIFKTEGVEPTHVVDILALMGDTVDNVPGVAGIGPKTAAKLILEYGTLDNLLAHLHEIKGKRRENIEAGRDQLALSRELVTLKDDLEVAFELEDARCDPRSFPVEELLASFRQLDFHQHADALRKLAEGAGGRGEAKADAAAGAEVREAVPEESRPGPESEPGLFTSAGEPAPPRAPSGDYRMITTAGDLDALVAELRGAEWIAVDTETDSVRPMRAALCGVSVSVTPGTGAYVPVRSPEPATHLGPDDVLDRLRPVLEDKSIGKIGHNIKYDMLVLRRHGITMQGAMFDTMVASYVIDATRSSHKMDVLALSLLGHTCIPITDLIGTGRSQRSFADVALQDAAPYAAEDADITLRLRDVMKPELESMGLVRLFEDVEMPLVEVLADLEHNGIRVDPGELERQREKLTERAEALREAIANAAPHPFNPDSPRQLAAALFNRSDQEPPGLGIKPTKRGKTGPSTDVEVLEKLAADPGVASPVPRLIIEYRQLMKLVNTYLVALKEVIHPETGRVHASFNQTVAATGRLSSSNPNLQNIPIRTDVGREIRRAFVADPGNVLVTADYSQIELRILAHLSGDPALVEAFAQGADIHTAVAAEVYGVPAGAVTREQRTSAKMINFGIVYGITPFGLARRLGPGTSVEEAAGIIAGYKARFTRIDTFLAECIAKAETDGYVETMLARRRKIPQIHARNQQQRALGERMAINTVVQGSAADLIKLAMIDLHQELPVEFPGVRMLLQIHDELVLETSADDADAVEQFVTKRMEHAMDLAVPLEVNTAHSTSWIDAK